MRLAHANTDLIITYRDQEEKAVTVAQEAESCGVKARTMMLNMNNFKSITPFVDSLKTLLKSEWKQDNIDFLINNAGMGATVPMEKVTEEIFDEFMNVHFKSVYFLTQHILNFMNSDGRVINLSSGTTRFSNPGYSVYASMKGAIEVLTKYIAKEYGVKGIRANVVAPGPVETDFNNGVIRNNPQIKGLLSSFSPLGRVGEAQDIGGVVAFLCSDAGSWINGQRIEVSGGINV
ncbi:SDR family NAD(P)-dependent oxidoreductase [Silvanigrella sp.]|uniref:SDR family NAD(P)-dependent oxidoreductase n=1 Tax=Silvanigrella sp. TaxID=2024976 RepID=UPI0037C90AD8